MAYKSLGLGSVDFRLCPNKRPVFFRFLHYKAKQCCIFYKFQLVIVYELAMIYDLVTFNSESF